jgi:protein-S-isoprenylcysteine O-methyltransferase Ste14
LDRWYVGAALYFVSVIVPYALEQVAYVRFTPHPANPQERKAASRYGWEYMWDVSHFILLVTTGYRMIFHMASLGWWDASGVVLFILGVVMRIWALHELSELYDTGVVIKREHHVVRSGPYHVLRHPLHMGTNFEIAGMALLAPWWLGGPLLAACLAYTLYRNRLEDKVLKEQFGPAYDRYYNETWDVVDLIYWKPRR